MCERKNFLMYPIPQSNTCIGAPILYPILPLRCFSAKTGLTKHVSSGAARSEYQHKHSNMTVSCSEHYKTSSPRCVGVRRCGGECVNNRSKDSSQIKQFNIGRTKSMWSWWITEKFLTRSIWGRNRFWNIWYFSDILMRTQCIYRKIF